MVDALVLHNALLLSQRRCITETAIASSKCAKLKQVGLAKCVIIADHVTFSRSGSNLSNVQHSRERDLLLCNKMLEKAIVLCEVNITLGAVL